MESMEVILFDNIYKDKKVFVTGHTGFKGSWLCLWLQALGAQVVGYSFPLDEINETNRHFQSLNLDCENHYSDICDIETLSQVMQKVKPDIVFHLAAQSLVREAYINPVSTFQTNLIGSLNLYESCLKVDSVKAIVSITTDKVYQNNEWNWGYREIDRLGGSDPYSASKSCVEIMTQSYRKSFFKDNKILLATARAGNVIGGGDWAKDRLIPDIIKAYQNEESIEIRNPNAVRPWQHVLESLTGYLLLGQRLLENKKSFADSWNFGPDEGDTISVEGILSRMQVYLPKVNVNYGNSEFSESQLLKLDCSKAKKELKWYPLWNIEETIKNTVLWYKAYLEDNRVISIQQLNEFIIKAKSNNATWVK